MRKSKLPGFTGSFDFGILPRAVFCGECGKPYCRQVWKMIKMRNEKES